MSRSFGCYRQTGSRTAVIGLCLLVGLLLVHTPSNAAEGGYGAYLPGYRNFMTGVVPSRPGLYIRNDLLVYSASSPRVVLNGFPVENISVDVIADIIEPTYVFPKKVFGGTHAALLTIPLARVKQSGRIIGTDIEPSDSRFSLGDVAVSPLFIGWQKGKVHYNANLAIFIPTGTYDINRVVNITRNYWTFDPEFGITYFDPSTGWDISAAIGYSFNTRNRDTDYQSGDVIHLDYAVGKQMKNGLKPGIVGYIWIQVTPDTGSGALFGDFESRVFGIGPAIQWRPANGPEMRFRYYHEFGARDHLEGNQFVFTLRMAF